MYLQFIEVTDIILKLEIEVDVPPLYGHPPFFIFSEPPAFA